MKTLYQTACTATHEARNGAVRSVDGLLDLTLAMPRELGGAGGATNPEQLFAAGYAACFTSALLRVGRESGIAVGKPSVTVHSGLGLDEAGRFKLLARIEVALPDVSQDTARRLVGEAHGICPFSRAVGESLGVTVALTDWQGADGAMMAADG